MKYYILRYTQAFDINMPVQTRDGRPVRILCTNGPGTYPIVGLIGPTPHSWTREGNVLQGSTLEYPEDLVNVPPPPPKKETRTYWLNLYPENDFHSATTHISRERANTAAKGLMCLACVPTTVEFTEGEGLVE